MRSRMDLYPRHVLKRPREAGILIPILVDQDEPRLLLTRRAETMTSHRGEVAFPGGMRDADDRDIIETALREAEEEVGLSRDNVQIVGQIDDLISVHREVMVTPSIGLVRSSVRWRTNPMEVAKIFTIPLSQLQEQNRWRAEFKTWGSRQVPIYYFDYEGETLWGLSAFATLLTLRLTRAGTPVQLDDYERIIRPEPIS